MCIRDRPGQDEPDGTPDQTASHHGGEEGGKHHRQGVLDPAVNDAGNKAVGGQLKGHGNGNREHRGHPEQHRAEQRGHKAHGKAPGAAQHKADVYKRQVFAQTLGFKTCLLSGSLTLVIMNLPTIIRTTQESLKTVPQGYREGALGLGAGKWHIIRTIVLPCSVDGIVTGCILAVGRIVGESAALLFTAGAAEVIAQNVVKAYTSNGATLSVLLYLRAFEDGDFDSAWAIGAVLLVLVLAINLAARLAKTKLKQKQ